VQSEIIVYKYSYYTDRRFHCGMILVGVKSEYKSTEFCGSAEDLIHHFKQEICSSFQFTADNLHLHVPIPINSIKGKLTRTAGQGVLISTRHAYNNLFYTKHISEEKQKISMLCILLKSTERS